MDESHAPGHEGKELIQTVVSLSGLPEELADRELTQLIADAGHSEENLTLEQLRAVMLKYLEAMNEEMLGSENPGLALGRK